MTHPPRAPSSGVKALEGMKMQFDHVIQEGIWVGSAEQIVCIEQAARDANFEGWDSVADYLHAIDAAHVESTTENDRGMIEVDAWERYVIMFRDSWNSSH